MSSSSDNTKRTAPWKQDSPVATLLLLPMQGVDPPELQMILQALADYTGQDLDIRSGDPPDPEMKWFCGCNVEGLGGPLTLWCEPTGDLASHFEQVVGEGYEWLAAFQVHLSEKDPLTSYINLVRLASACMGTSPAMLDPSSGHWLERTWIDEEFMGDEFEPAEDVLWRIDVIESESSPESGRWIRTAGLVRCGRAELECIGVPATRTAEAVDLVGNLAAMSLEIDLPGAGTPMEIGPGMQICFQPVKDVIGSLPDSIPGSIASRDVGGDDHSLAAVILDPGGDGQTHPSEVLEALSTGDLALFHTQRRTRQDTLRAQAGWADLVRACSQLIENGVEHTCLVQVPFEQVDSEDEIREHLWLSIVSIDEISVEAELVHAPQLVEGVDPGWRTKVTVEEISGWILHGPHGTADPSIPGSLDPYLEGN